jgi:hypothetical protein
MLELKERGWTPAMIRDLLGKHDGERKSELQVGSRGRRTEGTVKLYLEERVRQAETTAAFALVQERARVRQDADAAARALPTRQANQDDLVAQYDALPAPMLERHPGEAKMSGGDLWNYHLSDFQNWQLEHNHLIRDLPSALRREVENRAYERYRKVFDDLYGDRPW